MSSTKPAFDHGAFWDSYSQRWETHGDGDGVHHQGVLGVEWTPSARTQWVFDRFAKPFIKPGARVLEIGPGGGKFSRMFDEAGVDLTLCDISPLMLSRASAACRKPPRTVLLDGRGLQPFADGHFDLVFSFDVFIHIEAEEFYRYLAEANRVLKPGGVFAVHTSTFESQYGMLAFLRQMRDHQQDIGTRYGGRMYPLTGHVLARFAEHNGFEVTDRSESWEDRDLVQALTKRTHAWPWIFITRQDLLASVEISERKGGTGPRPMYAIALREQGREALMEIGAPDDDVLKRRAVARIPKHPALLAPTGTIAALGLFAVLYPQIRGVALRRLAHDPAFTETTRETTEYVRHLITLVDGMQVAHRAGLAHGELSNETVYADDISRHMCIAGFHDPGTEALADMQTADRKCMANALRALPLPPWALRRVHDVAKAIESDEFCAREFLSEA
jgi:SAM-dependent methyltransferase